ncbi:MAG: hypothetical protein GYB67_06810 [Chloroflexi bacterium]|nr:hypothetical protein [Chloroflexota bacterium]
MRTPAGKECRHYYEDYNRGRNIQECRLIKSNLESLPWRPQYCGRCAVPDILNANASPNLSLKLTVKPIALGLGRTLDIQASCLRHHIPIEDAFVGCPKCNAERPGLDVFWEALGTSDDE